MEEDNDQLVPFNPRPKRTRLSKNKHHHQNPGLRPPGLADITEEIDHVPGPSGVGGVRKVKKEPTPEDLREIPIARSTRALVEQHMEVLRELNWRPADVKPYKSVPTRCIMPYRVRRVVSPFEFYLELAFDEECCDFQTFFQQIQTYYNNEANAEDMSLIKGKVLKGRPYVCQNGGKWYRVRAHDVNQECETAKVFYCDTGLLEQAHFSRLREIEPQFQAHSAQLFRAYLYDIYPTLWTKNACKFFKSLVMGKDLDGIIMARTDKEVSPGLPDFITEVGVVLFEIGDWTEFGSQPCSINAQMVDKEYCHANGIFAGCKHVVSSAWVPESKCDMDEMEAKFPSCTVDKETLDTRIPAVLEERQISLLMDNPNRTLPPPTKTWAKSREPEVVPVVLQETEREATTTEICLPDNIAEQLAHVKLSCVMGPEFIILHLYSQLEELHDMQLALQRACSRMDPLPPDQILPGTFVACRMSDSNDAKNINVWARAIVKQGIRESAVKLLLVDYGNFLTLAHSHIFELPEYFQTIPSYAHRVHLDVKGLTPFGLPTWSSDCCFGFRRYIFSWEGKDPVYFMYRPPHADWIELDDFTQGIHYNFEALKWEARPRKKIQAHQPLNDKKENIMLRSLFHSIGVEINYEVMVPDSDFWHFDTVADIIVHSGFGEYQSRPKSKLGLHLEINLPEPAPMEGALRFSLGQSKSTFNRWLASDMGSMRMDTMSNGSSHAASYVEYDYNEPASVEPVPGHSTPTTNGGPSLGESDNTRRFMVKVSDHSSTEATAGSMDSGGDTTEGEEGDNW